MSYSGDPSACPRDAVRLEIGKTVSEKYLDDDEIEYCISQANGNILLAASYAADKISGICSDLADKSIGGSSITWSQRAEAWRKKSQDLLAKAKSPTLTPRASSSRSSTRKFGIGQHDFHGYGY